MSILLRRVGNGKGSLRYPFWGLTSFTMVFSTTAIHGSFRVVTVNLVLYGNQAPR